MINKREKVFIGIIASLLVVILGLAYYKQEPIQIESYQDPDLELEQLEKQEDEEIYVHISGRVREPGLIKLKDKIRLSDAIDLCGGLLEDSDISRINLAQKLKDQDKIHIPSLDENMELELPEQGLIDINNCSREELLSLPGIGEKKADMILDYRQANNFQSIEDIMQVSGIGEKTFEGFKDMIRVN